MSLTPDTTVVTEFELEQGEQRVTLRKVRTPNGERLELSANDETTRLDAVELEALTWQDAEFFSELVGHEYDLPDVDVETEFDPDMKIGNEYSTMLLRRVAADDGERLYMVSPKMGYATEIDASVFRALIEKPKTFFSGLLHTPYGPEENHGGMGH